MAVASGEPTVALPGGALFLIQGARVAYNHQGAGYRMLAALPSVESMWPSSWYRRQIYGLLIVGLAAGAIYYDTGWR
jgi:hypothetical protein